MRDLRLMAVLAGWLACAMTSATAAVEVILPVGSPKPWERTAGKELVDYLEKLKVGEGASVDGISPVRFHVGDTELARRHGLASEGLEDEEWVIRSFDGEIVLNGGGTRGALYAVYHFLEDFCGVRFWSATDEDVPVREKLELGSLNVRGKPAFFYRDIYTTSDVNAADPRFAIRRRLNRFGDVPIPLKFGGALDYGPPYHCHTFNRYVSWEKFGRSQPELFSLVDGQRCGAQANAMKGQLCLSNPKTFALLRELLLTNIVESSVTAREEGRQAPRIFEISMNDNHRYCQCDRCRAEYGKYGVSGQYLNFVNRLAADAKTVRPDVLLSTLAYYFTEDPPSNGVRAADNVIVKLCNTRQNMAASILADGRNAIMRNLLDVWCGLADRLFVWDYDITFTPDSTGYPFPSEFHFVDKYRFYRSHNVRGIFWEQEIPGDDLYDLKFYLKTRLFEDPDCDYAVLLKQSFREYFGREAGDLLFEARQRLADAQMRNAGCLTWFPEFKEFAFIRSEDVAFIERNFDVAAQAAAGDGKRASRVAKVRVAFERFRTRRNDVGWGKLPDGTFWNDRSRWFMSAPTLGFRSIVEAVSYRFDIIDDRHRLMRLTSGKPEVSLDEIWKDLPVGYVTVDAIGLLADGSVTGEAGRRTFWKKATFCPEGTAEDVKGIGAELVSTNCLAANRMIRDVLAMRPQTPERLSLAETWMKFVEDQFVHWTVPYGNRPPEDFAVEKGLAWTVPCAVGTFDGCAPDEMSTVECVRSFYAVYKATGERILLDKAKALANALSGVRERIAPEILSVLDAVGADEGK